MEHFISKTERSFCDSYGFSSAVAVGDLIIMSGVIGRAPDDQRFDSCEAEFEDAWKRIATTLESMGSSLDKIADIQSFHFDQQFEVMKAFMKVKSATLGDHKPTWTAVGASGPAIPNARVEIRIIAEKR